MKIRDLFEKWNLTALKVKIPILEMDWTPGDADKDAAWEIDHFDHVAHDFKATTD